MQLELFDNKIPLEDIFEAYYECRKNKRNKTGALQFEVDLEDNLVKLWEEINSDTWEPLPSTVFIVEKPVTREIFAAAFRDRIVHHLVIGRLNPLFEKCFIYDSYSCRKGKGTHFGVARASRFIQRKEPAWVLKLDICGYFMSIDRNILFKKLELFINKHYHALDKERIKKICHIIIYNNPAKNCIYQSPIKLWEKLPKDKSLFTAKKDCGLPIGNLTSQVFANFYLNEFDHFIKKDCSITEYGRYVDDFIIIHPSRIFLKLLINKIEKYLHNNLGLKLHSKKIYLQPCQNGVKFLGCFIKPSHIVINHRTIKNFKKSINTHNDIAGEHKPDREECNAFISSINSYLGILKHYKTYKKRKHILMKNISPLWYKQIIISSMEFGKIIKR
ncbi:MAG: reverse transcriptase/maturase family protein [Treponema sp.]|nr:reverse transcriptase/maturase family protein [Treponema sp.]